MLACACCGCCIWGVLVTVILELLLLLTRICLIMANVLPLLRSACGVDGASEVPPWLSRPFTLVRLCVSLSRGTQRTESVSRRLVTCVWLEVKIRRIFSGRSLALPLRVTWAEEAPVTGSFGTVSLSLLLFCPLLYSCGVVTTEECKSASTEARGAEIGAGGVLTGVTVVEEGHFEEAETVAGVGVVAFLCMARSSKLQTSCMIFDLPSAAKSGGRDFMVGEMLSKKRSITCRGSGGLIGDTVTDGGAWAIDSLCATDSRSKVRKRVTISNDEHIMSLAMSIWERSSCRLPIESRRARIMRRTSIERRDRFASGSAVLPSDLSSHNECGY